jgi:hypothetical protein
VYRSVRLPLITHETLTKLAVGAETLGDDELVIDPLMFITGA